MGIRDRHRRYPTDVLISFSYRQTNVVRRISVLMRIASEPCADQTYGGTRVR